MSVPAALLWKMFAALAVLMLVEIGRDVATGDWALLAIDIVLCALNALGAGYYHQISRSEGR